MQKSPWVPLPSELPQAFVSATKTLFDQGLADPRGCEYREIEVPVGEPWSGDGGVVKTHGWVFTEKATGDGRFAICWNGLVYPAISIGAKADLTLDIRVVASDDQRLNEIAHRLFQVDMAPRDATSVATNRLSPLRSCLLLRLGEVELAAMVWKPFGAAWEGRRDRTSPDDPYLLLAGEWIWTLFDRAVCAHMRADDNLALLTAEALTRVNGAVEAECGKRGFEKTQFLNWRGEAAQRAYVGFLEPLPRLLADQKRRADRGDHRSVIEAGLENYRDQNKRIAALVDSLDEVATRQLGQPGAVAPEYDAIVAALIKEGEPAVEPLLVCMETDRRLTRSVGFSRDFHRDRIIVSVRGAARAALEHILHAEFSDASEARAFWARNKGVSLEERWYRMLQEESGRALEAARNILQPENEIGIPGAGHYRNLPVKTGERPKFRGEILRNKKNPSVAELLAKHAQSAAQQAARLDQSMGVDALRDGVDFTSLLSKWERTAAVPAARALAQRAMELFRDERSFIMSSGHDLARYISKLTKVRVDGGDDGALVEFTSWLKSADPKKIDSYFLDVFEPLWMSPDHPAVADAVNWLFNDHASPWYSLVTTNRTLLYYRTPDLITTPLVAIPGFQQNLFRQLADTNQAGIVKTLERGQIEVKVTVGNGSTTGGPLYDTSEAVVGTEMPFRLCDYYAWKLSQLDGTPYFQLFWKEPRRDEAIAAMVTFLKRYRERYTFNESLPSPEHSWPRNQAQMSFPRLDRPATRDDVDQNRAIFSLEGKTPARVISLPLHPMPARWTTLKDYPFHTQSFDPKTGQTSDRILYNQEGNVWQAEELTVDGKTSRFYGFVGKFVVAKVPAEEIEFVETHDWLWASLSRGLDCRLDIPWLNRSEMALRLPEARIGKPITFSVLLRNRSGLEQTVPSEYYRQQPAPALLAGVTIELSRLSDEAVSQELVRGKAPRGNLERLEWSALTPKSDRHFTTTDQRRLQLGESFEAGRFDLNDWFEISKPGAYKVRLAFAPTATQPAQGESPEFIFVAK